MKNECYRLIAEPTRYDFSDKMICWAMTFLLQYGYDTLSISCWWGAFALYPTIHTLTQFSKTPTSLYLDLYTLKNIWWKYPGEYFLTLSWLFVTNILVNILTNLNCIIAAKSLQHKSGEKISSCLWLVVTRSADPITAHFFAAIVKKVCFRSYFSKVFHALIHVNKITW